MYLEKINGPEDIKKLNIEDLKILADETRTALINKISNAGGHNGPNWWHIITHAAFYASWPNAWAVFNLAKEVYSDETSKEEHGGM